MRTSDETQTIVTATLAAHVRQPYERGYICSCGLVLATQQEGWTHAGKAIEIALGHSPSHRPRPATVRGQA